MNSENSEPTLWGRQKGVTPICSDFFVFFRCVPICTPCFREYPDLFRFAPISSALFRFVFRTNQGNPFLPTPFASPRKNIKVLAVMPYAGPVLWTHPRLPQRISRKLSGVGWAGGLAGGCRNSNLADGEPPSVKCSTCERWPCKWFKISDSICVWCWHTSLCILVYFWQSPLSWRSDSDACSVAQSRVDWHAHLGGSLVGV